MTIINVDELKIRLSDEDEKIIEIWARIKENRVLLKTVYRVKGKFRFTCG